MRIRHHQMVVEEEEGRYRDTAFQGEPPALSAVPMPGMPCQLNRYDTDSYARRLGSCSGFLSLASGLAWLSSFEQA